MWLLDWLVQRWSKLYDWFGDGYWTLRGLVSNIPSYINQLSSMVIGYYNSAVAAIGAKISNFYQSTILPIINALANNAAGIIQKVDAIWSNFWHWVGNLPSMIENAKQNVINWAVSKYDGWINTIENISKFTRDILIPALQGKIDLMLLFKPYLDTLQAKLTPSWLDDLMNSWGTVKFIAITLATNPLGFILGLLWSVAIEFLSFVIAYAMGTTKYSLPAIPNWGGQSGARNIPLPNNSGSLARPLASLVISGYTFGGTHYGVDFGLSVGEPVYASHDGVVSVAGWSTVGYGNYIDLAGDPYFSRYAHLSGFNVSTGQSVRKGQVIGYGGSTGNSTGPHLHYELKINGSYVDPVAYL